MHKQQVKGFADASTACVVHDLQPSMSFCMIHTCVSSYPSQHLTIYSSTCHFVLFDTSFTSSSVPNSPQPLPCAKRHHATHASLHITSLAPLSAWQAFAMSLSTMHSMPALASKLLNFSLCFFFLFSLFFLVFLVPHLLSTAAGLWCRQATSSEEVPDPVPGCCREARPPYQWPP